MCSLLVFGSHGRRVGHGRVIPRNQSDLNLTARIPLLLPNYAPPPIPKGLFLPRCGLRRLGFLCHGQSRPQVDAEWVERRSVFWAPV